MTEAAHQQEDDRERGDERGGADGFGRSAAGRACGGEDG
jgi:hypothetical protein